VGVHDNFFELGGDSILSIQIVSRARRAGLMLNPRDVFDHQSIEALAKAAGTVSVTQAEQGNVSGEVPLVPIQHWFFAQDLAEPAHWNQSVWLQVRAGLAFETLREAMRTLLEQHDGLRLRFESSGGEWQQRNLAEESHELVHYENFSKLNPDAQADAMAIAAERWQASLDLSAGPLLRVVWFDLGPSQPAKLLITLHHLIVDGVSWRILLEDLQTLCAGSALPAKTTSFQH
jgi:hypothetical protein